MAKPPKAPTPIITTKTGVPIQFPWDERRKRIDVILLYCGLAIAVLIWVGDTTTRNTIAFGLIGLAVSTIGSHIFGAVWDDSNARKAAVASEATVIESEGPPADVTVQVSGDKPTVQAG